MVRVDRTRCSWTASTWQRCYSAQTALADDNHSVIVRKPLITQSAALQPLHNVHYVKCVCVAFSASEQPLSWGGGMTSWKMARVCCVGGHLSRHFTVEVDLCYTHVVNADLSVLGDGFGPMQRWESSDKDLLAREIFARLTGERPETLEQIAMSKGLPRGVLVRWFATEERELLDAAEKVLGVEVAHLVRGMTDEVTQETLGVMKFKTDRYLRLAELMNPERYGRKTEVKHSGLTPTLVIEIKGETRQVERMVEGVPAPAHEMI